MIIDCSVLGNALGRESVDGDDTSSALAAAHGRKYNNARVALPLSREFVSKNYSEVDKLLQIISAKTSSTCAELQKLMTPEQIKSGRETSLRSRAIREARTHIINSSMTWDADRFSEANSRIRAGVLSKLTFTCGVSVSARRVKDTKGLDKKGQFKRKNISASEGASRTAYVTTADEKGLKKVPVLKGMRDQAEKMVYSFALIIQEVVSKIPGDITDDAVMAALKELADKLPGSGSLKVEVPEFTDQELETVTKWTQEILSKYQSI